jgi:hypothetical protein
MSREIPHRRRILRSDRGTVGIELNEARGLFSLAAPTITVAAKGVSLPDFARSV